MMAVGHGGETKKNVMKSVVRMSCWSEEGGVYDLKVFRPLVRKLMILGQSASVDRYLLPASESILKT